MEIKPFQIDVLVDAENLCNLEKEGRFLNKKLEAGGRIVLFGRRNTGKSSLVKNVVLPHLRKNKKNHLSLFADFYAVQSLEDIAQRMQRALEMALSKSFPVRNFLESLPKILGSLRPVAKTDSYTGEVSIGLDIDHHKAFQTLPLLFDSIHKIHKKTGVVIALDEFQDIGNVPSAEGIIRDCFQNLPHDLPIIVMGSKKHMLTTLFTRAKAPFAGWGIDYEIPIIHETSYRTAYWEYANERFKAFHFSIDQDVMNYLIDRMNGIPEAVNIVCLGLTIKGNLPSKKLSRLSIDHAISDAIAMRQSRFNEALGSFTDAERKVLAAIAHIGPVEHPKSKGFLSKIPNLSPTGIFNAFKRLERRADIYRDIRGYVIADPLFSEFLRVMH